jgi:predicted transcriptional regulator
MVGEYNRALYTISDTMLKDLMNSLERKKEIADFLLTTITNKEPNSLREALESPNREE